MPSKNRRAARQGAGTTGTQTAGSGGTGTTGTASRNPSTLMDTALENVRNAARLAHQVGASQADITGIIGKGFRENWL